MIAVPSQKVPIPKQSGASPLVYRHTILKLLFQQTFRVVYVGLRVRVLGKWAY